MPKTLSHRAKDYFLHHPIRYTRFFIALERFINRPPEERMTEVALQFARAHRLPGDYLEFGCFEGASIIRAMRFARTFGPEAMRFYAFDSFRGLPRVRGADDNDNCIFREGDYTCSREDFDRAIRAARVDRSHLTIIEGWYRDTLTPHARTELPIRKAAVVWIDCDLYESTVPVLDFITPYMQDGTFIVFDDWFAFKGRPDQGQPKAFAQWLDRNPSFSAVSYRQSDWACRAFIITLNPDPVAADIFRRTIGW